MLDPFKHLGAAYESIGENAYALKFVYDAAIQIIKDHSNQIDKAEISELYKYFLQRAKAITHAAVMQITNTRNMSADETRLVTRAKSYDEDLISIAEQEYGDQSSEYAAAHMDKVITLVAICHEDSQEIIDSLEIAIEAEKSALEKVQKKGPSSLLLRIQIYKGTIFW